MRIYPKMYEWTCILVDVNDLHVSVVSRHLKEQLTSTKQTVQQWALLVQKVIHEHLVPVISLSHQFIFEEIQKCSLIAFVFESASDLYVLKISRAGELLFVS